MKYTIITGNPIDGFQCWNIFDDMEAAISWADNDAQLSETWAVMPIEININPERIEA